MDRKDITAEGLRIGIGFPSAVLLVMGGIIGVGIFVNPAVVARGLTSPLLVLAAWGADFTQGWVVDGKLVGYDPGPFPGKPDRSLSGQRGLHFPLAPPLALDKMVGFPT